MGDEKRCEKVLCCEVLQSLIVCGHADEVWDGTRCRAGANGLWCWSFSLFGHSLDLEKFTSCAYFHTCYCCVKSRR